MRKRVLNYSIVISILTSLLVSLVAFQNCSGNIQYKKSESSCEGEEGCGYLKSDKWNYEIEWGSCSKTCGSGLQSRNVWCEDSSGNSVKDEACDISSKPPSSRACNVHSCNANYYWVSNAWSSCQQGTQTRTLRCYSTQSSTYVNNSNCPSSSSPATSRSCVKTTYQSYIEDISEDNLDVDIFLVIDDSSSMETEQEKLSNQMTKFMSSLSSSGLNWQMCLTTTDTAYYRGQAITWVGADTHILSSSVSSYDQVFSNTLDQIGSAGTNDEQAIKASYLAVMDNSKSKCMREKAALVIIILSDEDERSVGGNFFLSSAQYKELGSQNDPANFIAKVDKVFSSDEHTKRLTVNSIIVRPDDTKCEALQDAQGASSFFGLHYAKLSYLTNGYIGNICDDNYGDNLSYSRDSILNSLSTATLLCKPLELELTTVPQIENLSYSLDGKEVTIRPPLPGGTKLVINYECQN